MLRRVTILAALVLLPLAAQAQIADATLKQIFAAHPDSLAKAEALGADLNTATFQRLTESAYSDSTVRFTAVLLSDPLNSGLASYNTTDSRVGRVHVFVRDTAAVSDPNGMAGYGAQVVDGDYENTGLLSLAPGAVITITGTIAYFSGVPQISPTAITVESQDYRALGLPDVIMDPIPVDLDDLNSAGLPDAITTTPQSTINFETYPLYAQEYVRIENLSFRSTPNGATRFNFYFTSNDDRSLDFRDVSIRFRNDRNNDAGYAGQGFNVRSEDFVPPPDGSRVNVQGFTVYSDFDNANLFNPGPHLQITPMEDSDLEVLAGAPPSVASVSRPDGLVTGAADVTITADVTPGEERTIATVELMAGAPGGAKTSYPMTVTTGTEYSGAIPASALTDGDFVEYFVRATDNAGSETDSQTETFRVLTTVDALADIQTTATGGAGASPLVGLTITPESALMDLEVTLQTDAAATNLFVAQDGTEPWSGIFLEADDAIKALAPGTVIRITGAAIVEAFSVTQLNDITFEVVSATGAPLPYAELTTTAVKDVPTAESYEGMLVRFNNVEIASTNADAPSDFGEWTFQSVGTTDAVRADDQSNGIPLGFNAGLTVGDKYSYIQGVWYFSFSNWKLLPQVEGDLVLSTANEGGELPVGFGLGRSYPNPASGATAIPFSLETAGFVTLDVFDTLGRRVAHVVSEERPAGVQEAAFDAQSLSAGLYLIRLTAGEKAETRSLVVVR